MFVLYISRADRYVMGSFYRDIFLLPGPDCNVTPRQSAKLELIKAGFLRTGVKFQKEGNEIEVLTTIRTALNDVVPDDVR